MYPDLDKRAHVFIALALICCIVYANALWAEFTYDDVPAILQNPRMSAPGTFIFQPPSLLTSWNYLLAKDKPFTYHLVNTLLHALNTILVFVFLRLFFKDPASFAGAALFAVHPIHVEAVTWIGARGYLLLTTFSLAIFILYYRSNGSRLRYAASLAIFSYCIACNFTLYAALPFFLAAADMIFGRARKNWKLLVPFFAVIAVKLFVSRGALLERFRGPWQNPFPNVINSVFSHLGLALWPGRLTLYHQPVIFPQVLLIIGIVSLAAVALAGRRIVTSAREIFFGLVLFILFLAPTYSPFPAEPLVAERYVYFPSVALCIAAAFIVERCQSKAGQARSICTAGLVFLLCVYAVRTVIRNEDWKTAGRLWRVTVDASPASPWAHYNVGRTYQAEGNADRALREFKMAIKLKPDLFDAYNSLGTVYHRIGRLNEALLVYQTLLTINPRSIKAYNNVGVIYHEMGRLDEAVAAYQKAIEIDPAYSTGFYNLSVLYQGMGKTNEARQAYQTAIALDPALGAAPEREVIR